MGDYISRDYAVENMENYPWDTEHDKNAAIHLVRELVPAADVRPVVRGEWKKAYADHEAFGVRPIYRYCSNCNETTVCMYNFCPYCGADMRGENYNA